MVALMISPKVIGFIAEGEDPDDTNRIGQDEPMLGRGSNGTYSMGSVS